MIRSNLKGVTCAFIVGILIALNVAVVFAASASSPYKYYGPVLGYKYKNITTVYSDSSGARGNVSVYSDGSGNIPAGYMGTQAFLINHTTGSVAKKTGVYYNSTSCAGIGITTANSTVNGAYYSNGYTYAYDGSSSYHAYQTYDSPRLNYP